ncbi:hypothetical protein [Salinisphaera sp. G21_0]|uniref:collagen-like triple helix repeat-containing protein n=1 Tax=Salinisphaera sp. G21_0 TaxID=2821094 RepID=UPI00256FDEA3|nr:hypothetical protein [Salinisphaera sp. G21_0]
MYPPQFEDTNIIRYATHGATGQNGACGANGEFGGHPGQHGTRGKCGQNAPALNVALSTYNGIVFAQGNQASHTFDLSNRKVSIILEARGGDAGDGGNGGDGGKGLTGRKGRNATRYRLGENGGQGGPGGKGGDGARGGDGGNGGEVTLTLAPSQTDLLMLTNIPDVRGGARGMGGRGGNGGPGGDGGEGGDSCWYTDTSSYTTSSGQTRSTRTLHVTPGGHRGHCGPPGQDGRNAPDGRRGNPGSFHIAVGHNQYPGPYDLSVTDYRLRLNNPGDDGFFEPGKAVSVDLSVTNTGYMPTPNTQPIRMSLVGNKWVSINPGSVFNLPFEIPSGKTVHPQESLEFTINRPPTIPTGEPLNETGIANFSATVGRIERQFSKVASQKISFPVRFPANIDAIEGNRSISRTEEALLCVKVNNISPKALGLQGSQQRLLKLNFKADTNNDQTRSEDVTFYSRDGAAFSGNQGLTKSIDDLPPYGQGGLSGSIAFNNPAQPLYSKVTLFAELELGRLDCPTDPRLSEVVHRRVFEVQLAEGYQYNPDADFLLVTNADTSLPEWNQWKTLADRLGLTFATWNSSLNNGISLYHEPQSGETEGHPPHPAVETDTSPLPAPEVPADSNVTLVDHFKDKTIIFLDNNPTCVRTLKPCDLFRSANSGVRSYIVGPNPVREDLFYPEKDLAANLSGRAKKTVVENYIRTMNRSSGDKLVKAAKKQAKKLQNKWPEKRFTVVYNYEDLPLPRNSLPIVGTYGPKKHQIGTLTSILSPTKHMFTNLSKQPDESDRSDYVLDPSNVYGLLKSLSLQKKIQLVQNNITEHRDTLKKAILSDLVDEHKAFSQKKWAGSIGKSALKKRLTCLQQVVNASYSEPGSKELIQEILIEFRAFAAQMPGLWDKLSHSHQRQLATVTKKMIDSFKQQEDIDTSNCLENYKAKKQSFTTIRRKDLWRHYQDSDVLPVPQNVLNDRNPVIDFNELQNPYEAERVSRVAENRRYFTDHRERLRALETLENGNSNDINP